jgi:hypothetical protein
MKRMLLAVLLCGFAAVTLAQTPPANAPSSSPPAAAPAAANATCKSQGCRQEARRRGPHELHEKVSDRRNDVLQHPSNRQEISWCGEDELHQEMRLRRDWDLNCLSMIFSENQYPLFGITL